MLWKKFFIFCFLFLALGEFLFSQESLRESSTTEICSLGSKEQKAICFAKKFKKQRDQYKILYDESDTELKKVNNLAEQEMKMLNDWAENQNEQMKNLTNLLEEEEKKMNRFYIYDSIYWGFGTAAIVGIPFVVGLETNSFALGGVASLSTGVFVIGLKFLIDKIFLMR